MFRAKRGLHAKKSERSFVKLLILSLAIILILIGVFTLNYNLLQIELNSASAVYTKEVRIIEKEVVKEEVEVVEEIIEDVVEEIEVIEIPMYLLGDTLIGDTQYSAQDIVTVSSIDGEFFVENELVSPELFSEYDETLHLDLGLKYEHQDLVRELIELMNIDTDEYFFYGLIYAESRFDYDAVSYSGAQGLMQIMPATWTEAYYKFCTKYPEFSTTIVNDPWDARSNLTIGIFILQDFAERLGGFNNGNDHRLLTSYNRGIGGANTHFSSTGSYITSYSTHVIQAGDYIRTHGTWEEGI